MIRSILAGLHKQNDPYIMTQSLNPSAVVPDRGAALVGGGLLPVFGKEELFSKKLALASGGCLIGMIGLRTFWRDFY